ncbi:hypothetical protein PSAB6_340150 [Paraburkholderia sabiae]|nr:hypothetical protein PSAB6_340150 [Paraburkholderia sabiae]
MSVTSFPDEVARAFAVGRAPIVDRRVLPANERRGATADVRPTRDFPNFPIIGLTTYRWHFNLSHLVRPDGFWCAARLPHGEVHRAAARARRRRHAVDTAAVERVPPNGEALRAAIA